MTSFACMLALALASGLGGGGAPRDLEVTIQDDALMLHGTHLSVRAATRRMAEAGADQVRITAGWSEIAPEPRSRRRPDFDAADPEAYPPGAWSRLDRAVRAVTADGMKPMIDVAFWAPRWAVAKPSRGKPGRERWIPSAPEFGAFAEAVGRRYSGRHPDPTDPGTTLPAVRLWTTWNEPNHAGFLLPQWKRSRGGWRPASPHIYRGLHEAAHDSLKRANPANRVLIGGLAARGRGGPGHRQGMGPIRFTRELACVDSALRPLRVPECEGFEPLRADGFAYHPYSLDTAPGVSNPDPDTAPIADLDRISSLLEGLHERGRTASELPLYLTEYGYESNPPDTRRGVALIDQARFHGHATFLAWKRRDTRMFAQFLLQDIGPDLTQPLASRRFWGDWQSGLYAHDGTAKPALQGFKLPFHAEIRHVAGRSVVLAFGQVRPGDGQQRVVIETAGADGVWRELESFDAGTGGAGCGDGGVAFLTDSAGFYARAVPYQPQLSYRPRWIRPDGGTEEGIPVAIGSEDPVAVNSGRLR